MRTFSFFCCAAFAVALLVGCAPTADKKAATDQHDEHAHDHPSEGPHGGHLIELGDEEYHAELHHDDAAKTVAIYILDKEAKNPVAIEETELTLNLVVDGTPRQAKLAAAPQEGDVAGRSSRFTVTDDQLIEVLEGPKTTGRMNVTIDGKRYTGEIVHDDHSTDHEGGHKH